MLLFIEENECPGQDYHMAYVPGLCFSDMTLVHGSVFMVTSKNSQHKIETNRETDIFYW